MLYTLVQFGWLGCMAGLACVSWLSVNRLAWVELSRVVQYFLEWFGWITQAELCYLVELGGWLWLCAWLG